MALRLSSPEVAKVAIQSIGRGYDASLNLRLKYCKGDSHLVVIDESLGRDVLLSGGVLIPDVPKAIQQGDLLDSVQTPINSFSYVKGINSMNNNVLGSGKGLYNSEDFGRALSEWHEYEEAVKEKDLARALRFLKDMSVQQQPRWGENSF